MKDLVGRCELPAAALVVMVLVLGGCNTTPMGHYATNRVNDFADMFQVGGGVTRQTAKAPIPPALGAHVTATEFLTFGAVHFTGQGAELDGRAAFAGKEKRDRLGLLFLKHTRLDQDYAGGKRNYFRNGAGSWAQRMESPEMSTRGGTPGKMLHYEDYAQEGTEKCLYRGFQHWETVGLELALSDPFLLKAGFDVRLGFDVSELTDFVLGLFCIDFWGDDLDPVTEANEVVQAPAPAAPAPG